MAFSEARRQGFSPGTPVSPSPSSVNGSANKTKLKELSLCTTWHATRPVARDERSMSCTFFATGPLGRTSWRRFAAQ